MAIVIKNSFLLGMDLDTSLFDLRNEAYIEALNITRDAIAGNNDLSITNIVGTTLRSYSLPSGINICIGSYANVLRNTVVYFVYNSSNHHSILQYNDTSKTITKIFESLTDSATDILGFTITGKITSVNIYPRDEGDLLYFIDSLGRPTGLNITRFIAGEYTPVTREIISVIKAPPLFPPSCIYGSDGTIRSNGLRNKEFRFKSLFVYDDFEESVCSPISAMALPANILDPTYTSVITNNNVINLSLFSGDKNVRSVKLLMSWSEKQDVWNDFVIVKNINKNDIVLSAVSTSSGYTQIVFSGSVVAGSTITINITRISDGATLVAATYTTVAGDSISSIISALVTQLNSSGYLSGTAATSSTGIYFNLNAILYSFLSTVIVNPNPPDNITFPYSFYNDSTYPLFEVKRSIQLFDYVPELANCQEMANGNTIEYGGITEGYDRDLVPNVVTTVLTQPAAGGATGNLNVVSSIISDTSLTQVFRLDISGIPAVGTTVVITIKRVSDSAILAGANYTTIAGDTATSVATQLAASFLFNGNVFSAVASGATVTVSTTALFASKKILNTIVVIAPSTVSASNSIPTWKWSTARNMGIAYGDEHWKTNGILYSSKVSFPAYAESGGNILLPYINTKIYHIPPTWATVFSFYFTKEPTTYLFWESSDVNTSETDYIYFNLTGLRVNAEKNPTTAKTLAYTFQDGDRMRLIKNTSSGTVFNDTYDAEVSGLLVDPVINSVAQPGTEWIKIKKVAPFAAVDYSAKFFVVELYRPAQSDAGGIEEVYFECAQTYPILNAGTSSRAHGGMVTNQVLSTNIPAEFNFYQGDSYFRPRVIALSETGVGLFNVQDRNLVDIYLSAVSSLEGRPNAIDENAKRAYYGAVIRNGEQYEPNTNVNGLNRFYPENLLEVDYSHGDLRRLKVRDRMMKTFQSFKVGFIPIFSQIHKEAGGTLIAQTDKLLNPIQYYIGDWGIGDAPASLASFNFADYFCDTNKGVAVRSSNDGLQPISTLYKINSFATDEIPQRTSPYNIYGSFYQKSNNYVFALEATGSSPAYTLAFDEETNAFESFLSYHPEMMCSLGTLFMSWKDGQLWTHDSPVYNNFYGVQYESYITMVFNVQGLEKKTWQSITEVASDIFDCPVIYTNVQSYPGQRQETNLLTSDFAVYEGNPSAAILRDTNSQGGIINGDFIKGNYIAIKFRKENASNLIYLSIVSAKYVDSPLTTK